MYQQILAILPILGLLRGELFPTEIRATAAGLTMSIGCTALMANLKLFPMAVKSLGFHYVVYIYAIITALLAAWGFLTKKNTDELCLVNIQDMHKNTEASRKRKCDHPEEEVRNEWNCDGRGATYSVANAVPAERNCYVNPLEVAESGNVPNMPEMKKISQTIHSPTLSTETTDL